MFIGEGAVRSCSCAMLAETPRYVRITVTAEFTEVRPSHPPSIEPAVMRTGSQPPGVRLRLASPDVTRQTRGGLRTALRETLPVQHSIRLLILMCLAGGGVAQADGTRVVNGSLGVTSDFVYRGLSLTRGKPTAQAAVDIEFPREIYVGGFIAGADPNPGPS